MKTHILTSQRDKDFLEACSRHKCWRNNAVRAALETATTVAPRYYIDVDYAYRRILDMRKNGKTPTRRTSRRLWNEIFDKVAVKVAMSPGISLIDAVTEVISAGNASEFFISPRNAVKIVRGYNHHRLKSNR